MSEPVKLAASRAPDWMSRLIQASAFAGREPKPRNFHVPDLLPARTVTILAGDGGMGKSTLALQLCAATILGKPWLGLTPAQGAVLYLSAEDDGDELERRIHDAAHFYDCDKAELDGLFLLPLADEDALLATEGERGVLRPTAAWGAFEALAEQVGPKLIVLDSLADVFGGNEINRAHARQFVALLRALAIRTDATVLLLAHPSLSGMTSGSGSSGSTHWNNAVRSRLYLAKPQADDDPDPDLRVLSLKKANYARAMPDMKLRRQIGGYRLEDGDGIPTLDRVAAQAKADAIFRQLVIGYSAQGRHVSSRPGPTYAPALFAKDPAANGMTKAGLTQAMNRLMAAGVLHEEAFGPPSRQRHRLAPTGGAGGG